MGELGKFCVCYPSLEGWWCCIVESHLSWKRPISHELKIGISFVSSYLVAMTMQIVVNLLNKCMLRQWTSVCMEIPHSDMVSFKKNPFIMTWLELCAELKTFCDSHPSLEDGGCCIMDRHLIPKILISHVIGDWHITSFKLSGCHDQADCSIGKVNPNL